MKQDSKRSVEMAYTDEFGIIDHFDRKKEYYSYEPEKYHCIVIDGEEIDAIWEDILKLKCYWHKMDQLRNGLARYGISIIPVESFDLFIEIVAKRKNLDSLLQLIRKAQKEGKAMIHFGV